MRFYRRVWTGTACLLGALGALVGLLNAHTPDVAGVIGVAVAAGCVAALIGRPESSRWGEARRTVTTGAVTAASGVSLLGLLQMFSPGALAAVVALAAASSPALHQYLATSLRYRRWRLPEIEPHNSPEGDGLERPQPSLPSAPVRSLSTAELCLAWRTSHPALCRARRRGDLPAQARLVALRQAYLDELERRDPAGFAEWLAHDARPTGDPRSYLNNPSDRSSD